MKERSIVRVEHDLDFDPDTDPVGCMYCPDGERCGNRVEATVVTEYEDEPDKAFHTDVCSDCLHEYTTAIDESHVHQ
jgi:hypothetical protein